MARYDNERGKGDHRHIMDREELYEFISLEQLFEDFFADIKKLGKETNDETKAIINWYKNRTRTSF